MEVAVRIISIRALDGSCGIGRTVCIPGVQRGIRIMVVYSNVTVAPSRYHSAMSYRIHFPRRSSYKLARARPLSTPRANGCVLEHHEDTAGMLLDG